MNNAKNTITLTGKLTIAEKLKNSQYGNPRYMLVIDNQVFYTKPNSSYGYCITNYRDKTITVSLSMFRGKLSLDLIEE